MLTTHATSLRQKSLLAVSLSWVAGYTNVISLVHCNMMTSHVTGNVTHLAQDVAHVLEGGGVRQLLLWAVLLISFFTGAFASAVMAMRSRYRLPIFVEALLLIIFGLLLWPGEGLADRALMAAPIAACAMGLQNATITRISGAVVRTTHLTGVVTDLGIAWASYLDWLKSRVRAKDSRLLRVVIASRRHDAAKRIALLYCIFFSFLIGAIAGTLVYDQSPTLCMIPPVAFLIVMTLRRSLR